jgi:hypothetical protein
MSTTGSPDGLPGEARKPTVPSSESEFAYLTATEQLARLATGEVSAVELARAAIARIERHDDDINALCVRDFDRALTAAAEADAARGRGDLLPLLGIPMTVEGVVQRRRPPDDVGYSAVSGLHADTRCRCRRPAEGGRRGGPRQDERSVRPG